MLPPSQIRASFEGIVNLGKYLKSKDRSCYLSGHQDMPKELTVWTDSDYARCKRTRKSTNGGLVMWGEHMIKSRSTVHAIGLFSGEA